MVGSSDIQPLTRPQEPRADSAGGETGPRGAETPGKATPQPGSPLPTWLSSHTGGLAGRLPPVLCGDRHRALSTQAPVGSIEHRLVCAARRRGTEARVELARSRFLAPLPPPPLLSSSLPPAPPGSEGRRGPGPWARLGKDTLAPPHLLPALISRQDGDHPDHLLEVKSGLQKTTLNAHQSLLSSCPDLGAWVPA